MTGSSSVPPLPLPSIPLLSPQLSSRRSPALLLLIYLRPLPTRLISSVAGVLEIKNSIEAIKSAVPSRISSTLLIVPLHANLTSQEQTLCFRPTPPGMRKIVVATNVAETSITIDGIVYVVDCGRVKAMNFDPESGITRLVEEWTSKAQCKQRRGRAGRTRPGVCYSASSRVPPRSMLRC
jgi:hypothetical protein